MERKFTITSFKCCLNNQLLLLMLFLATGTCQVNAQCALGSVNAGNITPGCSALSGSLTLPASAYGTFSAVTGVSYTATTCGTGWDSQITGYDASNVFLSGFYNDDNNGINNGTCTTANNESQVDWTATYTGTVKVQVNGYNCWNPGSWKGTSAILRIRQNTTITNTTSTATMCGNGSTRALTSTFGGTFGSPTATYSLLSGPGSVSGTTYTATGSGTAVIRAAIGVCFSDISIPVSANPVLTLPNVCTTGTSAVSAGGVTVSWSANTGSFSPTSGATSTYTPAAITAPTQNATITVTAVNGACTVTGTLRVDNNNAISSPPTALCNSTSTATISGTISGVTWAASSGSFSPTTGQNSTLTLPTVTPPTQNVTITISATNGVCTVKTAPIRIDDINSISSPPTAICNSTTTATITGNVAGVSWSSSAGSVSPATGTSTTFTIPSISPPTQNTSVTISASNGSCTTQTAIIRIDDNNALSSPPSALCNNTSTATITNNVNGVTWSASSGSFSPATGLSSTLTIPTVTPPTQNQTITISAANGSCPAQTTTIRIDDQNTISSPPVGICNTVTTAALSGTVSGVVWSVSGGGSVTSPGQNTTFTLPVISPPTQNQSVTVSAVNGTCSNSAIIRVDDDNALSSPPAALCNNVSTATITNTVNGVSWSASSGSFSPATGLSSTLTIPVITPPTQNQTITISATNGACTVKTATIRIDDQNSITSPPSAICNTVSTVTISGTVSGVTWSTVGGGSMSPSTGQNSTLTIPIISPPTQNQNITVSAVNGVCNASAAIRIDDDNSITSPPTALCNSSSTASISGTVSGVTWSSSAGTPTTPGQNTTLTLPVISPPTQNQTITLSATNGICATKTAVIRIDDNNSITSPPTAVCNSITTYTINGTVSGVTWSTAGGGSMSPSSGQNSTLTIPTVTPPTQNQTITVSAVNGACSASAAIRVDNQNSITSPPSAICNSTTPTISGTVSGVTWTSTAGTVTSPGQNTTFTPPTITAPTANTNITISAVNGVCATQTAAIRIDNQNSITSPPSALCDNTGTTAINGTISGVVWSVASGAGTTGSSATTPGQNTTLTVGDVTGTSNANANITLTGTNGSCSASATIRLDNNPSPNAGAAISQCNNGSFTLAGTPNPVLYGTSSWTCTNNCSGVSIINSSSPAASVGGVPVNTSVSMQWEIDNGTCSQTSSTTIRNDNQASVTGSTAVCVNDANVQYNSVGAATTPSPVWSVSPSSAGTITSSGVFNASAISGSTISIPATIVLQNGSCTTNYSTTIYNQAYITGMPNMCETDPPVILSAQINGNTVYTGTGLSFTGSGVSFNAGLGKYIFTPPAPSGVSQNYTITLHMGTSDCGDIAFITVYKNVSAANAGPNQELCNTSTFTLAGNNPTTGVGTWTKISGPGTITNPALYNTTVTGVTAGSSTVMQWTIVNGVCTSSSQVTLTNDAIPTTSNAGTNQEQCNTSTFTLAGNTPSVGTGLWTITSGPGSITTAGSPTSTITGVTAGSSTTLQWTISNGVCTASSSSVTLQNDAVPTTSNAGSNQAQCNTSTFTLAGNSPSVGSGIWTKISGAGTITTPTSATSTVTGVTVGTSTVLQWTITNGLCTSSSQVTLTNDAVPTTANAGSNQEQCNTSTFTLAGNTPTIGTGLWSITSGPGTITTPTSSTSTVTGVTAGNSTVLQWTISNGSCTASSASVTLQNDAVPTTSNAGTNQEQCNTSTFTLAGNSPSVGTGLWTIVSGPGSITTPSSATSTVTGVTAGNSTVLQWTITNGLCNSSSQVTLLNDAAVTVSNAGIDQEQCNTSTFTLAGNTPSVGSGLWSIVSGPGSITTPTSSTSTVTGVTAGNSTVVQWTITNGLCTSNSRVTLQNDAVPTSATAGSNQEQCNTSTFTLAGNTPSVGSGTWSVVSGPGNITTPTSPTSTVTGVTAGSSTVLQWTITNGLCSSSAQVTLTNDAPPTTSNAGSNQTLCNTSTFTLAGNSPSVGSGAWSKISGPGTITTAGSPTSTVTGVTAGSATVLQWTITNGLCTSSSTVTVQNDATPTTANAGSNVQACGTTVTLAGNTPTIGVGTWSQISGPGSTTFTTANTPAAVTSVTALGAYDYQWSIANGVCAPSTSTVTVTYVVVPVDVPPTAQANPVCKGSSTNIQLSTSQSGVDYQLRLVTTGNGSTTHTNIGSTVAGTGAAINLPTGTLTATDTFDVFGTNTLGCSIVMSTTPAVIVTNPDFALGSLIVHTNFGSTGNTTLPSGWSAPTNGNGDQWVLSSANPANATDYQYYGSSGLTAASTGAYAKTPTGASSATPAVELITSTINTTGYSNISVYWGAMKTSDYTGNVSLYYSIDNGSTWSSALAFIDAQTDVTGNPWNLINNTVQIKLPTAANNISTLKLKLTANPSTGSGYYSVNDFSVYGLSTINLCGAANFTLNYMGPSCSASTYSISSDPGNPWPSFSAVTNASLPSSITVAVPTSPQTPAGTYNLDLSMADASSNSSGAVSFPVTTDPTITATVRLENCACINASNVFSDVISVYATGGNGVFTFSPVTSGDALQTTIDASGIAYSGSHTGVKGVFWSAADAATHQYTVTDGQCSLTVSKKTQSGAPTQIPFASATQSPASLPGQGGGNGIGGSYNNSGANSPGISSTLVNGPALTCHQTADFGNKWVTYMINNVDGSGNVMPNDSTNNKAIVEINNYGQDLDSVSVSVYREPYLPSVPSHAGGAGACYQFPAYALERHFVIQSSKSNGANSFASDIGVRLYFSDAELQDLIYWTNYLATTNAGGPNASCAAAQVVNNTSQLYVTKYTGRLEDGDYGNNDVNGLYRLFGPNVTLPGNGPSYFDGANGNGVFGNGLGANRHFVEVNVREFSEFWLSGSGDLEPLPVEMTYFEADPINNEYIQLRWATAIEINNKEFEVERSQDGQNWSKIGAVDGHGNTTTTNNYTFDDKNVVPNVRYYYRLKQVDFNLNYKYTGIVSAEIYGQDNFTINLAPNPTTGNTTLIINTIKEQNISVEIFDVIGQKVVSGNQQIAAGVNHLEYNLSNLASGTYSVTVTSANQIYTKKLVISK